MLNSPGHENRKFPDTSRKRTATACDKHETLLERNLVHRSGVNEPDCASADAFRHEDHVDVAKMNDSEDKTIAREKAEATQSSDCDASNDGGDPEDDNAPWKPVEEWTVSDVAHWLSVNKFYEYVEMFASQHKIDGPVLLLITEKDLRSPPLSMPVLGDIKRLVACLKVLKSMNGEIHSQNCPTRKLENSYIETRHNHLSNGSSLSTPASHNRLGHAGSCSSSYRRQISRRLPVEVVKLLISYLYMFVVFMMTAFTMVIVHDRVPDMAKYPPLPDIMLDNLPYIPWAFEACEATAVVLLAILSVILIFHRHRFIIMRRFFALTGTVFMLRCITMLITSLSVPGTHLRCEPKADGDLASKLQRAFVIWYGFGMSLQGVRTCGDYMFSGHTVVVTLLNFFITEYTSPRIPMLHTLTWMMNIFAIFFILAAHEHYSIDVFVAFYITSRLFLYYHSLANNRVLSQPDSERTRIWFPLFSFFEASIDGAVPNEYESPFAALCRYFYDIILWFSFLRQDSNISPHDSPRREEQKKQGLIAAGFIAAKSQKLVWDSPHKEPKLCEELVRDSPRKVPKSCTGLHQDSPHKSLN